MPPDITVDSVPTGQYFYYSRYTLCHNDTLCVMQSVPGAPDDATWGGGRVSARQQMRFELTPYTIPLFVSAGVAAIAAVLAWWKRSEPGSRALTLYLVAVGFGCITYALDISFVTPGAKFFWTRLAMVAMAVTGSAWVYFALQYTGREQWANRQTRLVLAVEPVVLTVAMFVPRLQPLVFTAPTEHGVGPLSSANVEIGPLFIGHFVYITITMFAATLLFVQLFLQARHLYRAQATAILIAALVPWGGVVIRMLGFAGDVDVSLFGWVFSGSAMALSLYRFRLIDPVPTAHTAIVEDMGDGILMLDRDGRIGDANPTARRLLATGDDSLTGTPIQDLFAEWDRIEQTGEDEWYEHAVTVDGDRRFLELQSSAFSDHHGRAIGELVVVRDVTDRTRREHQLTRYKTVFESVRDRVYVLDSDDRFTMVNEPLASLLGYEPADLVGEPFETVLPEGESPLSSDSTAATDGGVVELTVETRDGESLPCETRIAPISLDRGESGAVGVIRDISERKAVEQSLAETTDRLQTLVEASPLAIVGTSRDGTVEVWNEAAEETFGWSADEVIGDTLPIVPASEREQVLADRDRVLDGEALTGLELQLKRADGSHIDASVSVAPVSDTAGEIHGVVAVIADVTERKERERKLRRQNERLDKFAGIVSHDLRNPLMVASGHLDLVEETGSQESIDHIRTAHRRIEQIIDDVLTLAREGRDIDDPQPVYMPTVVDRAWATTDTGNATLTVGDDLGTVDSDPSRLLELFENLFRNSVEHGSTSNRTSSKSDDSVEHGGDSVAVSVGSLDEGAGFYVADDGPGIPESDREGVFDTGFTTAHDGTGFGLSIVQTVAEAHGWSVSVTESESGGARFEFRES